MEEFCHFYKQSLAIKMQILVSNFVNENYLSINILDEKCKEELIELFKICLESSSNLLNQLHEKQEQKENIEKVKDFIGLFFNKTEEEQL